MKKYILPLAAIAVSIIALVLSFLNNSEQKKIAYFDYNKVYNECKLKKELEKDLLKVVNLRKSELDSMQLELSLLSNRVQSGKANQSELDKFEDLKNRYLTFQDKYEQENVRLKEDYFTQIRQHINELSREYAENAELDFFISASGDGTLMYAKKSFDLTDDFLIYVNKK